MDAEGEAPDAGALIQTTLGWVDLAGIISATNTGLISDLMFSDIDIESWRVRGFELCWTAHGGSGLGLSWEDVLNLPVSEAEWLYNAVDRRRREEAKAMRAASKGK